MAPSTMMMMASSPSTTIPRSSTTSTKKKKKSSFSSFQKNEQSSSSPVVVVFPKRTSRFASSSTTVVAAALLMLMNANATIAPCEAAQVVDWLTSGAEASPEELMRIMKESAKEDWDPTRVAPRVKDDDDDAQKTRKEEEASSDDVWEKNINANQFGMNREDLSADGYDIEAPIVSSDTFGRLGKFGAILIGADFVTAFIMGKSVLGVAKGLEKGEGEKRDWKESAAEMVMDKLKAKAEALKEQEGEMGETDEEKEKES